MSVMLIKLHAGVLDTEWSAVYTCMYTFDREKTTLESRHMWV